MQKRRLGFSSKRFGGLRVVTPSPVLSLPYHRTPGIGGLNRYIGISSLLVSYVVCMVQSPRPSCNEGVGIVGNGICHGIRQGLKGLSVACWVLKAGVGMRSITVSPPSPLKKERANLHNQTR